jgi:hypothetical protein
MYNKRKTSHGFDGFHRSEINLRNPRQSVA